MICKNCKEDIKHVNCHRFFANHDPVTYGVFEDEKDLEIEILGGEEEGHAYYITVPDNITALELFDSENLGDFKDNMACPVCNEFPFEFNDIEIHNSRVDIVFV